jgi:hypothetical protein
MRACVPRICCLTVLLSAACGYNPTAKMEADASLGGAGAQAGAIADASAGTAITPDLDAAITSDLDAAIPADTGRIISTGGSTGVATGGKGGVTGTAGREGTGTGGSTGTTGAGGAIVKLDAGPNPDSAVTDAPMGTCPAPAAPANGKVDPKSLSVGGQAIYTCDTGYGRPSLESRTCQADGTWSGANPTCTPVDCGNLENPKNGKVTTPATTYKSEATYSCDPNYGPNPAGKRTCQADGTWSGTAPTCQCEQKMCNGVCVDLKADVANCGDCGKVCSTVAPSTVQCVPTGCLVTLVRPIDLGDFTIDGTYAYYSVIQKGTVNRVPTQGGEPTLLADGLDAPGSLVVNAGKLYWGGSYSQPVIQFIPLTADKLPVTLASGMNSPGVFAVNSTDLYHLTNSGIARVPLAGGASSLFVSTSGGQARAIALDATNLYYVYETSSSMKIMKQPLAGGTEPTILASATQVEALAVDATNAYWTTKETSDAKGTVSKVPLAGGSSTVLASGLDGPQDIVTDGTYVYWTGDFGGQVVKLPVAGGTPTMLIASRWSAKSLALDATSVYWFENRNDTGKTTVAISKLTPR